MFTLYQILRRIHRGETLTLHKEIQRQRQQGIALFLFAVACHQQQEQHDQQIACVKILGEQLLQKADSTGILAAWWNGCRMLMLGWMTRLGLLRLFVSLLSVLRSLIMDAVFLKRAVRLWDITVVHGVHLPDKNGIAPL